MQCQVKTRSFLALVIITFALQMTQADEIGWSSLSGPKIEVENFSSAQGEVISSYLPYFQEIGSVFWSWDPKKELKKPTDRKFRDEQYPKTIELMKSLFVQFDISDTNHFRKVWFNFTSENKFRGLLGIHDFQKKRAFIVLRMGIHGNVDELIAERFLARLIYEDLDANLLVIESLSSHAFLEKNKNISLGGVDEGIQTFLAINEFAHSKFRSLIGNVHVVGLSMGSHGTFVTALLDQTNGHRIKSIVNFCPLINLKETFDVHENGESNLQNAIVDIWNVRRLKTLFTIYKNNEKLEEWWKTIFDLKPRFTPAVLDILNVKAKHPLISVAQIEQLVPNMKWPEGLKEHFNKSQSLFELNNFWPFYKNIKTPMMIYTTPNDPLVINELNSELIFSGKQPGDFSHLKFERLESGIHCGLAPVYEWEYVVKLVRDGLGE